MKTNNEIDGEAPDTFYETEAYTKEKQIGSEADSIEYTASLLKQLKMIADQSGHKMLYHLVNMAEMEANYILQQKEKNNKQ
ncbi:MAG: hypothetical protein JJ964_07030 [Rhizobiales bacterium]|nr:hypothetical protein [Hyphomicrobiales bacterium]